MVKKTKKSLHLSFEIALVFEEHSVKEQTLTSHDLQNKSPYPQQRAMSRLLGGWDR